MELPGKKGHLSYTGKEGSRERRRDSGTQSTESGEQRHLTRTLTEADCVGLDLHQHFSHSMKLLVTLPLCQVCVCRKSRPVLPEACKEKVGCPGGHWGWVGPTLLEKGKRRCFRQQGRGSINIKSHGVPEEKEKKQ